jgi:hypothetical protein
MKENCAVKVDANNFDAADDLQGGEESIWDLLDKDAPVSASQHLPLEMWREIFSHCLRRAEEGYNVPSVSQAPLALTQVCRGWRWMAHSTPTLWSSAHIGGPRRQFNGHTQLVHTWFKRSRHLPLSISVDASELDAVDARSRKPHKELLPTLKLPAFWGFHSRRIQNLQLHIPKSLSDSILNNPDAPLTSLEHLSLHVMPIPALTRDQVFPPHFDITVSRSACHLHILDLWFGARYTYSQHIDFAWNQLTRLTSSSSMSLHQCHDLIHNCFNLDSCYFGKVLFYTDDALSLPLTTHSHLRSLIICFYGRNDGPIQADAGPLLNCLILPVLSNLELIFISRPGQRPNGQIFSMLERSSCPIKRLVYYRNGLHLSETDIILFLRRFESLVEVNNKGRELMQPSMLTSAAPLPFSLKNFQQSTDTVELPSFPLLGWSELSDQKKSLGFLH